jgi:hypothetical protein
LARIASYCLVLVGVGIVDSLVVLFRIGLYLDSIGFNWRVLACVWLVLTCMLVVLARIWLVLVRIWIVWGQMRSYCLAVAPISLNVAGLYFVRMGSYLGCIGAYWLILVRIGSYRFLFGSYWLVFGSYWLV